MSPLCAVLALAAALAATGCDKAPAHSMAEPQPTPVRVVRVTFATRDAGLLLSGTVRARTVSELGFRVGGKVIARPVDVGDHVRRGQEIAELDQRDLQLAVGVAQAAMVSAASDATNARAAFGRYERLGPRSPAYMASEYDRRAAAMQMAGARLAEAARQLQLARDQLAYGRLTADADGVITALPVQVGQVVRAGQTVATLARSGETEVVVDVPENRLAEIRAAREIRVALWADPGHLLAGRLREIGAQADPASRTFLVKVALLDPPGLVALGMTASVRFIGPPATPVAVLPATALTEHDGAPAVWVLDPRRQRAALRPVTIGRYTSDGEVTITSGLAAGEQVVTAGLSEINATMRLTAWAGPER